MYIGLKLLIFDMSQVVIAIFGSIKVNQINLKFFKFYDF